METPMKDMKGCEPAASAAKMPGKKAAKSKNPFAKKAMGKGGY